MYRQLLVVFFILLSAFFSRAQFDQNYRAGGVTEIKNKLASLDVLGSALYIAAHPDDENTRMITYLAKEKHLRTGYFSITRGDGGQNLIGPEKGKLMGMIRTQELLAAREIDGGVQFFSRANDFGYSKTASETFNIWDREKVLADLVWVIRKFKPDVLITRFPPPEYEYRTHGHHQASAILAEEAFEAAADPKRFPEQLEYVETWQAKRLMWNTSTWFYRRSEIEFDPEDKVNVDVGEYSFLEGQAYTEIAADSRSQHKSQGFGAIKSRGEELEWLEFVAGEKPEKDLIEGVNTGWNRVTSDNRIQALINELREEFKADKPYDLSVRLVALHKLISDLPESYWKKHKLREVEQLLGLVNGIWFETRSEQYFAARGSKIYLKHELIKRGPNAVQLEKIILPYGITRSFNSQIDNNTLFEEADSLNIPEEADLSNPYWLKNDMASIGMYSVPELGKRGLPVSQEFAAKYVINIDGIKVEYKKPIAYRWRDPVEGERYRPVEVTPFATANISDKVYIFANEDAQEISIRVKSHLSNIDIEVSPVVPEGWKVKPEKQKVAFGMKGDEKLLSFSLIPPNKQASGEIGVELSSGSRSSNYGLSIIDYNHIPIQTYMPVSSAKIVRLDIKKKGKKLAYLMGAGDEVPESLRQIGYELDLLSESDLGEVDLSKYDAIIAGIRLYNTSNRISYYYDQLMEYVKNGGTYIVQYSKSYGLKTDKIGPYPFQISYDRVTVEDAPVKILQPEHPIFNIPNKISQNDFEGWVQERGLYFPNEWNEEYTPLLSSHDPGEEPKLGGMLVAEYGEGHFIYSGYSWFRQLPAGIPGAYRLFANMISYGQ